MSRLTTDYPGLPPEEEPLEELDDVLETVADQNWVKVAHFFMRNCSWAIPEGGRPELRRRDAALKGSSRRFFSVAGLPVFSVTDNCLLPAIGDY